MVLIFRASRLRSKYLRSLRHSRCSRVCRVKAVSAPTTAQDRYHHSPQTSAILGFARAYGEILPFENVTFNAICPHVVRTNISSSTSFYDELEKQGLMTDIQNVVAGFEEFLGTTDRSGQCFEVGPRASRVVSFMPYMDEETRVSSEAVMGRSGGLWKD